MSSAFSSMRRQRTVRRDVLLLLAGSFIALALFTGITFFRIVRAGSGDNVARADAIVVFGAAEYVGRPSPVYRARLDHAFDLFQHGAAPIVITTGGQGADLHFSEGGVGREYLKKRGIPDSHLIAETQGSDTAHSAQRVAVIMRTNKMHSAIAVSDAYHIFRIKQMMAGEGVTAYGDPRPDSWPRTRRGQISAIAREFASYALWRVHLN